MCYLYDNNLKRKPKYKTIYRELPKKSKFQEITNHYEYNLFYHVF